MSSPSKFLLAAALWLAIILPSFSQPLNDDCANATALAVSPAAVCGALTKGKTEQATPSPLPPCAGCPNRADVWYRFTATKTAHLVRVSDVQYLFGQSNAGLLNLSAFTGTCGNLLPLGRETSFYTQSQLLLGNLTVGETYYLRLLCSENNADYPVRFDICVSTPQPPVNDECAGAAPISADCSSQTSGSLFGATASRKDCTGQSAADVWYVFAALSAAQRVQLSTVSVDGYGFELYAGDDCDHLTSIGCKQSTPYISSYRTFEGLTVGAVYYLRVFGSAYQYPDFQVCISTVPPPPPNDECAGALSFDANPDYACNLRIYGSTLGATSSQPDCTGAEQTHDVWHSFKATGSAHRLGFSYVQPIYGDGQSLGYEVYSGSCGSLISLVCKRNGEPNALLSGLIPGEIYFVRVYSLNSTNHTYEFCVQTLPPPPANTDCATATVLTSEPLPACGTPVTGTTEGLVLAQPATACSQQGEGMFVWYSFQATYSTHVAQVSDVTQRYGPGNCWVELYEGSDCGTLKELGCYPYSTFVNWVFLKNLTVGATYYLRFGSPVSSAHSFQICLGHYPQPLNDDCAGALPLTLHGDLNCYYPSNGNTASSTASQPATTCLGGKNDVWFRFKALQTTQRVSIGAMQSVEDGTYQRLTMELFKGSCGNLIALKCWPDSLQTPGTTLLITDLEPGHTYFLRFAHADDVPVRFEVCLLTPPPPPANDRCVDATVLTPMPGGQCEKTSGTTKSATTTSILPALCCERGDVWYQFTANQTNHDVQVSEVGIWYNDDQFAYYNSVTVEVYANCSDAVPVFQKYVHSSGVLQLTKLSPGATYWVRVYPNQNDYARFNICVSAPPAPANDDCAGALPLQVSTDLNCFSEQFSTYGATASLRPDCDGAAVSDLWYQFEAMATAYRFDVSDTYFGIKGDRGMEVLSGSCGQFASLACWKFSEQRKELEQQGFVPGETYYVRLWGEASVPQQWEMCVRALPAPPPNDDCAGAQLLTTNPALPCNAPTAGTTLGAAQSLPSCANGGETRDVWYTFTAESGSNFLEINDIQQLLGNGGLNCELLAGDCATGVSIFCKNDMGSWKNWWALPDLAPGQQYLLRVYSRALEAHSFSVCLTALPKPPNDNCTQATVAAVNPDLKCQLTYPGTTVGASKEAGFEQTDVWYVFTALASTHLIQLDKMEAVYGWNGYLRFAVYEGNPCDKGPLVGEFDPYNPMQVDGLMPGQTYSVRVFSTDSSSASTFDLCIRTLPPPPANSNCQTVQALPVNPALACGLVMHGSTLGLLGELRRAVRCYSSEQAENVHELWYSFAAITPNHLLRVSNVAPVTGFQNWYLEVVVMKSNDCEHFEKVGCVYLGHDLVLGNLTPGQTYYVVASTGDNRVAVEFDLCLMTYAVPDNDLCAQATPLTVAPDEQCSTLVAGTTLSATPSSGLPDCSDPGNDVWYTFTATHSAHSVRVSDAYGIVAGGYYSLAMYGGDDCGQLKTLFCGSQLVSPYQISMGDLVPGQRYWVCVWQPNGDINFNICVTTPPEPPANDACANAVALAVSPDLNCSAPVPGTTVGALPSAALYHASYQNYTPWNDVWYTFTATQANHAVVLSNHPGAFDYLDMAAYTGACGALVQVSGARAYNSNELKLLDLTPGETYYVRIFTHPFIPQTFDICVVSLPVPPNDECAGALLLEENTDLECKLKTTAAIGWATQSAPDCAGGKAHDVWFKFVATATDYRLDMGHYNPSGNYPKFGLEVLEGSCGALSVVLPCAEQTAASVSLHQLSVGKTYYVRLYAKLLDLFETEICLRTLPAPPANDDCAQVIDIQPGNTADCGPLYTGTTLSSTPSGKDCDGQPSNDVWYRFTADQPNCLLEIAKTKYYFDYSNSIGLTLYKGDGCGNLSEVECFNLYGMPASLPALTVGSTYYLRVFCSPNTAFDFTLCLRNVQMNTSCSSAVRIQPSPNDQCGQPTSGSTSGLSETVYSTCDGSYYHTALWYRFTATSGIHLIRLQNVANQYGGEGLFMELLSSCHSYHLGCGQEIFATNLNPGQDYFVRVVGPINSGSRFELCVLTPEQPDNDNCPGAVALPVSPNLDCTAKTPGTTLGATGSYNKFNCKNGPDVLYKFVATSARHDIRLSDVEPSANVGQAFVEVLRGPCGSWATSEGCYPVLPEIALSDLMPGETYYLRIGSGSPKDYFRFEVCIVTPQPDLYVFQISPHNNGCQPGQKESVEVYFGNAGAGSIAEQTAQFTLTLSGANTGVYGPVSNPYVLHQYDQRSLIFNDVDLSQPGETQLMVTAVLLTDPDANNNTFTHTFTSLPLRPFYRDADGDGYGDPANSTQDCQPSNGYVDDKSDCDDNDPARNPGASEVCNGFDDNCDGLTDVEDPGLTDAPPPTITCPDNITRPNDPDVCYAAVTYAVSTGDFCGYTLKQVEGLPSGAGFPVGTTLNTFIVNGFDGSTASCSFTVEVQKTADPDLAYTYTIIGLSDVSLKNNTVQSGGIGVTGAGKKARLQGGATVTAANTFVKAPVLELAGGSQVKSVFTGQVPAAFLPVFKTNSAPTGNNLSIPNNAAPVTLTLNSYGTLIVGANATLIFAGPATVRIRELSLQEGAKVVFNQNTELLVNSALTIGRSADFNPGGARTVQCFVGKNVAVGAGAKVAAGIYTLQDLQLEQATAASPTAMTGQFIANNVLAEDFVIWNWDAARCPASGPKSPAEDRREEHQTVLGQMRISPNPTALDTELAFSLETASEVTVEIVDVAGQLVYTEHFVGTAGPNRHLLRLNRLAGGAYAVQVSAQGQRQLGKLMVLRP